jgi:hypothetical protein
MTPKPAGAAKNDNKDGKRSVLWAWVLSGLLVLAALWIILDVYNEQKEGELLKPDSPPGEHLYLDRSRVRSYLGQLVDGLPESEKRTLADSEDLSAEVKAGAAALTGKRTRSKTTEAQVAPTVADRFYLLLRLLRDGDSHIDDEDSRHWLTTVNANTDKPKEAYDDFLCKLKEGDFIRIRDARLQLSPYAAVLPKTTYALLNRRTPSGLVSKPDQKLFAPHTRKQTRAVNRYLRLLGRDPRMPFVVRMPLTQTPTRGRVPSVTFFIPAHYRSLRSEPSLISGTLTIVGKVVYRNLARPPAEKGGERIGCNDQPVPDTFAKSYLDRQTVATFVPALENAPNFVFNNLRFTIASVAKQVTGNMTVTPPLIVVVPIAMYQ